MDKDEVRACLRALLSSTAFSYNLNSLLHDFKTMTGFDMPLFEYIHPVEFLKTLNDTVQLFGDPFNPQIALVESQKSSHITSLVERQKTKTFCRRYPNLLNRQKRLVLPNRITESDNVTEDTSKVSQGQENYKEISTSLPMMFKFQYSTNFALCKSNEEDPKLSSYSPSIDSKHVPEEKPKESVIVKTVTVPDAIENYSSEKNNTSSSQELPTTQKEIIEKPPPESPKKDDSHYFDISDNDSCENITSKNNSNSTVNEGIKLKFRKLIKNYPDGLWCCELPKIFLEEYNYMLDYREFGYTSLIQLLSELPEVFRCIRPGNEDWILFDASSPPSATEMKMKELEYAAEISSDIKRNLQRLLLNCFKTESRVELSTVLELYQKTFGSSLDLQYLGFKDIKSLLMTWEGSFLDILKIGGKTYISPRLKVTTHSPIHWEEAIPPVTEENDLFVEIFPKDVVGPNETLPELELMRHVAVGNVVDVCIAEVWSPKKFYLQFNKFKQSLNRFMDDMQHFYENYVNKYKMPDSTLRPNQVCAGLYNSDPEIPEEWHRAQIVKVINEKTVLINFVDYGTVGRLKKTQLRFLHRKFQSFPIQAFEAQLTGIVPPNNESKWSLMTSKKFLQLTQVPYLKAEVDDIDFKTPRMCVTLFDPYEKSGISINQKLVNQKLAEVKESAFEDPFLIPEAETKPSEDTTKDKDISSEVSTHENVPEVRDEFSDIADLAQTTLFHFKMKSLSLDESLPSKKKDESEPDSNVGFEFEEVPDLEKEEETHVLEEKTNVEITKCDLFENEENPPDLKGVSFLSKKLRNPNSGTDEELQKPTQQNGTTSNEIRSSFSDRGSRVPPGLENVNVLPNFRFYLQPEEYKKRVNLLALELLSTKPSIKQVGVNNPALALEIATEMAEAYIASQYPIPRLPYNFGPLSVQPFGSGVLPVPQVDPNFYGNKGPAVPVIPVFPVPPPLRKPTETTTPINDKKEFNSSQEDNPQVDPAKNNNDYITLTKIAGMELHVITIDDEIYFCAEEIVRKFTLISSREVADRVLLMKNFHTNYRVITNGTDQKVLNAIKSNLIVNKGASKKLKIYLIPLTQVLPFLQALGCLTTTFENDFMKLHLTKMERTNEAKGELV